jgi:hypothetical protein
MPNFIFKDGGGKVVAHVVGSVAPGGYEETTESADVLGQKWNGSKWVDGRNKKEKALDELALIDQKSGMSRTMRETLIAVGAEKAPAVVKDFEAAAAVLRADLV